MEKQIIDILKKTRKLLSNKNKWTKGNYSRSGKFCLVGAIIESCNSNKEKLFLSDCVDIIGHKNNIKTDLERWNDSKERTHKDILKALDKAIKK